MKYTPIILRKVLCSLCFLVIEPYRVANRSYFNRELFSFLLFSSL